MTFAELANQGYCPAVMKPGSHRPGGARTRLDPAGIIKLASNEESFRALAEGVAAGEKALREAQLYPDGGYFALRQKLAAKWNLGMDQFIVGNGSNEILELLGHAFLAPGVECVMHQVSFIVYKLVS